ncbi:SF1B family DNA helicase RecD2 [Levilactobacillus brevis]|uniref:SF1B family DNA helicase RecD2 n=1 Tax=Levilactobacillus brevis TaxID=1580 RepID=UPI000A20BE24|nr:ATP-dependent RecD-like DNA helicase [Levilactobacillus brevis]ARN89932.1 exodeoxyribonuclease V subunit alpha [Levilactobacillus brevis]ARN97569.1 exodeoxyribonuclease V subunit alpha [Levilactobacillus brevis]TYA98609.1 ATP-dependent RecD-like DNA helicase [Lactobacillus sp. SL9-6]
MATESLDLFATDNAGQPDFVVGTVSAVFFASNDSFYKVMLVKVSETSLDWHEDEIVVTGNFADVKDDVTYRFTGKRVEHPKYGVQFQADNYQNETPTSRSGVIAYLSGDDFPGLGKKTAEKIVDALGTNAIEEILNDSAVLAPLGLSPKVTATLVSQLQTNNGMEQIIIGLNGYGFGSSLAAAIYNRYQEKTLDVIHENPYQLAEDITGVSFKRADQIATQLGYAADKPERLQAGLLQTLTDLSVANGDTYTTAKPLLNQALSLLENSRNVRLEPTKLAEQLLELAKQQKVVGDDQRIYLKALYDAEWQVAEHLQRLLQADTQQATFSEEAIAKQLRIVEKQANIVYDDSQTAALTAALQAKIMLLTGGPGTGKTTIIRGLVNLYARLHEVSLDINEYKDKPFPILLAAPTGRAAKRMSESTGLPASTIHRLLGLTGRETDLDAATTKDLEGGLLIIDEVSMVDVYLMKTLLRAVPVGMQVVLVGDKDQLPSVGPGQVFHDLLASDQLAKIQLDTIYRQGDGSSIIPLAHAIKAGKLPADFTQNHADRSFIACHANQVESVIDQIVAKAHAKGFSASDIQVLAPMYRGSAGIDRLNVVLQNILNPKKTARQKEVTFRNQQFRIGDKVLHLVNSPENNVFNGDIGTITGIDLASDKNSKVKSDQLTIAFEQTEVTYARNDWIRLTLAYCMSIHKAQGSEFKLVILPMVSQYNRMLQRNLLYTAVTRAADMLILLGEPQAFETCVTNLSVNRHTTLTTRIQTVLDPDKTSSASSKSADDAQPQPVAVAEPAAVADASAPTTDHDVATATAQDYQLTPALVQARQIDPMIGMQGITPQQFMPSL